MSNNGQTDDAAAGGVKVHETSVPEKRADSLSQSVDLAATVTPLSPTPPLAAPSPADGTAAESSRSVVTCKCGAPQHAVNLEICAKGHAWIGNQRTRRNPLEALEDDEDEGPVDHVQLAKDTLSLLRREYRKLRRHLKLNLTSTGRRAARKDLRALSDEILQHARFLESVEPTQGGAGVRERRAFLALLSEGTLAAVLKDLGVERLEDVPDYAGPLPLKVELTDAPAPAELQPMPAEPAANRIPQPDAIARKWLSVEDDPGPDFGMRSTPVLVVGAREKAPADFGQPYQFDNEGNRHELQPNNPRSYIDGQPVHNWRGQAGFGWLAIPTAGTGPAIA
jgi:hypothetical protein